MPEGAAAVVKVRLMYRDRDFDLQQELPENEATLVQDLELEVMLNTMADGDDFLFQVAKQAVLSGFKCDAETVVYRQAVLSDCLRRYPVVKEIYDITTDLIERKRGRWLGIYSRYPGGVLSEATGLLEVLVELLDTLKLITDEHADQFESDGFKAFFALLKRELTDEYFSEVRTHLKQLEFDEGVLVSVELGPGNQGANYVLRKSKLDKPRWSWRIFAREDEAYTYRVDARDDAGARVLGELRERGIDLVANAVAQSAEHISSFFNLLRTELAFYLGCTNLYCELRDKGAPMCFPVPRPVGACSYSFAGLRDLNLSLILNEGVVGNDLNAREKNLVIITGANQGGKSTFLRSVGIAQLMMQCGMFVVANSFSANMYRSLFTHYRRQEDATMKHGKFDEELSRMSNIVDLLTPDSLLLFNESFAGTNEREGSGVASQIVQGILEAGATIFFVTHLYEFAHGLWRDKLNRAAFLRAERQEDGARTFKLLPGEPLETSFGADLYAEIMK
jgi:DNA mismatch repair ATPase MutS